MSSDSTFQTNDFRSSAVDSKRDAAHKHKWALGSYESVTRASSGHVRPFRPSETYFTARRRESKGAVAALQGSNTAKMARKQDMLDGAEGVAALSSSDEDHSGSELSTSPPADAGVMYSFDKPRGPSHGSQILTAALAKAVERYEERETVKLVSREYDVLDEDGESVVSGPAKREKGKGRAMARVPDADEEYEFL